jgi:transcriptional regulator with XRE-family HTH domain
MPGALASIIDDLEDRGRLKGIDIANIADVSAATVSRWKTGKAMPQPGTQLLIADLRYVVDRLADIYTPEETRLWLYAKNALLDGERAIDLIHQGRAEEVLAVIERLDAGAFL